MVRFGLLRAWSTINDILPEKIRLEIGVCYPVP